MINDYDFRKNKFRSIKAKALTMAKIDWIREQMQAVMGYQLSKCETLHVITMEYAKRWEIMKIQKDGNR